MCSGKLLAQERCGIAGTTDGDTGSCRAVCSLRQSGRRSSICDLRPYRGRHTTLLSVSNGQCVPWQLLSRGGHGTSCTTAEIQDHGSPHRPVTGASRAESQYSSLNSVLTQQAALNSAACSLHRFYHGFKCFNWVCRLKRAVVLGMLARQSQQTSAKCKPACRLRSRLKILTMESWSYATLTDLSLCHLKLMKSRAGSCNDLCNTMTKFGGQSY